MVPPRSIAALLATNTPPTALDIPFIQSQVDELTLKISALLDAARKLEEQRTKYRAVLSAVRRVPAEILGEIFSMLLPLDLAPADRTAVMRLGLVCRDWRIALLGTLSVWSGLVLDACSCSRYGPHDVAVAHNDNYDGMIQWFSNARGSPKRFSYLVSSQLCYAHREGGNALYRCEADHPTVTRLLKQGPQLDQFTLQVAGPDCFRRWLHCVEGSPNTPDPASSNANTPWQSLRSFELLFISSEFHIWTNPRDPESSIFARLPPITSFRLDLPARISAFEDEDDPSVRHLNIPSSSLERLTSLHLKWDWGVRLLDLLAQCANLELCTIDLDSSTVVLEADADPEAAKWSASLVSLPLLREFRLHRGCIELLDYLEMPALRSMELELAVGELRTGHVTICITRLVERCGLSTTLQYLRVCGLRPDVVTTNVAFVYLPILSALQVLELDSPRIEVYQFGLPDLHQARFREYHMLPVLRHLRLLNLIRSEWTLSSEILYLMKRIRYQSCSITVSYSDGPAFSEEQLQSLVPAPNSQLLSVHVVPSFDSTDKGRKSKPVRRA
ncbi:hypothetical protein DFP72DRAFT_849881 [Ephemerocybe angulata]|uniref:F-box domain-containing protein n=1 Tax=Ephemerocybe angulata TaxID=980116 RepID=A0A8H6HU34_9AGAR|nr:hypothetical protein DFP72DRAFT_849881 [Tulosesus angulatus]